MSMRSSYDKPIPLVTLYMKSRPAYDSDTALNVENAEYIN